LLFSVAIPKKGIAMINKKQVINALSGIDISTPNHVCVVKVVLHEFECFFIGLEIKKLFPTPIQSHSVEPVQIVQALDGGNVFPSSKMKVGMSRSHHLRF
jgi:hypothetical protein